MKTKYLAWVAAAVLLAGCDSSLDTNPTASIDAETALGNARGIELGLTGAYRGLQRSGLYNQELMVLPDLYADNLDFSGTYSTHQEISLRNVSAANAALSDAWSQSYAGINRVNNVLSAIPKVTDMSEAAKGQARGEGLFLRGLFYLNLVRYFGGVPLVTEPSTGVDESSFVSRASLQESYAFIEKDLEEAASLLSAARADGRATKGAANALLARAYLEEAKYTQARDKATAVIGSGTYQLVANYRDLFTSKNSSESIMEVQYSVNNSNSQAFWFFPQALGGRFGYTPSASLNSAFEAGDTRKAASIGTSGASRYGNKYFRVANGDDDVFVVRLAEMYLIRAEANAQIGADPATVRADINVIRRRAGLADLPTTVTSKQALLDAVLQERRVEFAMEGQRFFDLRRLGRAQAVLGITESRLLFPIPQGERDVNPNLAQNPGY
ncbi:MAG: RagB/SusD family nutrient uptake outer membrane protein [Gemmatimonadetes bacterium]|nr:RagB/SusD family nutrient uptake outer membrane protein [Gemmatimonadota bacterium]